MFSFGLVLVDGRFVWRCPVVSCLGLTSTESREGLVLRTGGEGGSVAVGDVSCL